MAAPAPPKPVYLCDSVVEDKMQLEFNKMLERVSGGLGSKYFGMIRTLCRDFIPEAERSAMTAGIDIFNVLIEQNRIHYKDTAFLCDLMDSIHRKDLVAEINSYTEAVDGMARWPSTSSLSPDLDRSRDACSESHEDVKKILVMQPLQIGRRTKLSQTSNRFGRLLKKGYRRAEVTVHLGQEHEPAGMYWFLLPGKTAMMAIERALDEACQNGTKTASLNFEVGKLSDTELSPSIETPDIAHWERLNPVSSSTSNLKLVELRVLNACRSGSRNVTYYYGIGGSSQKFEEELSEDSGSDFLTMFADTCCSVEASDRYGAELCFMFDQPIRAGTEGTLSQIIERESIPCDQGLVKEPSFGTQEDDEEIYACGPEFEFNLETVSPMLWDKRLEEDLFYRVDPSQFDNHSNLCRSIFGSCVTGVTEFGLQIHFKELILCMTHRDMLTSEEVDQLKDESVSMSDKAMNLTINILPSKGEMFKPISLFYSCLMESAMTEDGLEDHYYLTQRLRESVHRNIHRQCGVLPETREYEKRQTAMMEVIGKVCRKFPDVSDTTKLALIDQLKLSRCTPPVTAEHSIPWIFECWRRLYPECDWTEIVEALVLVPRLGYLVSNLLSPCRSSPPQMCSLVHSLENDWPVLAKHLGYPWQLVQTIQNCRARSPLSQIEAFLKYWVFPDCETANHLIVGRLRTCLGKDVEIPQSQHIANTLHQGLGYLQKEDHKTEELIMPKESSTKNQKCEAEETLQQFCSIYLKAVISTVDCKTLVLLAESAGKPDAAKFFRNYRQMSPRDLKSGLVQGNRESALSFLIEQKALDMETFNTVAMERYRNEELDDFYRNLICAVRMIPGSESISVDQPDMIMKILDLLLVEGGHDTHTMASSTTTESPAHQHPITFSARHHYQRQDGRISIDRSRSSVDGTLQPTDPQLLQHREGYLVGVDIIAEDTLEITREACIFELIGCGVKLHILQDSLPVNCQKCTLRIRASLSGQYKLPPNCELVSGVYWVHCSVKLNKHVTLEVQHCGTQTGKLSFIRAESTKEPLAPYLFQILEGGEFPKGSTHGSIELSAFSLYAIVMWCASFVFPRSYSAKVYRSLTETRNTWTMFFTVKQALDLGEEAFCSRLESEMRQSIHDIVVQPFPVKFAASQIGLEIKNSDDDGWELMCPIHSVIERSTVDNFKGRTGDILPLLQIIAKFPREEIESTLKRRIDLEGVEDPHKYFLLQCSEPTTSDPAGVLPQPQLFSMPSMLSCEARVFLDNRLLICTMIKGSVQHSIASKAYVCGLITQGVYEDVTEVHSLWTDNQRTDTFLTQLELKIKSDKTALKTFLDVLTELDPYFYASLISTIKQALNAVRTQAMNSPSSQSISEAAVSPKSTKVDFSPASANERSASSVSDAKAICLLDEPPYDHHSKGPVNSNPTGFDGPNSYATASASPTHGPNLNSPPHSGTRDLRRTRTSFVEFIQDYWLFITFCVVIFAVILSLS